MGNSTNIPQFRDSSISTMLRTNPDEIFEFTTPQDSLSSIDSSENDSPDDTSQPVVSPQNNVVVSQPINIDASIQNTEATETVNDTVDSNYFMEWGTFPSLQTVSTCIDTSLNDSILIDSVTVESIVDTSFVEQNNIVERESSSNDWMTVAIIIILFVTGWIRLNFSRQLSQIIKAFFSFRQSSRLYNEQNNIQQNISSVMDVLFFLVTSVFISQLLDFFNYDFLGLSLIYSSLVVSLIYIGLIYLKVAIYKAVGYLFDNIIVTSEYIHNTFVVKKVLALVVLPLLIAIPFVPDTLSLWLINIGVLLYALFYFLQVLKGIQIIILKNQSIVYSFLYLCALEIVPLLIIWKIVSLFL